MTGMVLPHAQNQDAAGIKVPPHSIEAEQAVLGGLMVDNSSWDRIADEVTDSDFYRHDHRQIFQAIARLASDSQPFDMVTVSETLKRQGELENAGGVSYLSELVRNIPSASNIRAYSAIVKERAVLRQLISISQEIADSAFNPQGRVASELLDEAERKVFQIAETRPSQGGPQDINPILTKTLERIDHLFNSDDAITGVTTGFHDLDGKTSGMQPSDLIIVAARPSMGKCIVAGSRILDPETGDRVPIETLVERQSGRLLTLADDYQLRTATPSAFVDDGLKPTFRVVTASGREIETTLTHPFLTGNGWKPLSEVRVGEVIGVPRQLPVFGQEALPDHEVKLLAYFIADGGTTQSCPQFTNSNLRIREDFAQAVADFDGVSCSLVEDEQRTPSLRVSAERESTVAARAEFAKNLRRLMDERCLTGRDVAGLAHVAPATVTYWLQAKSLPGADAFAALVAGLEVAEEQLLTKGHAGAGKNDKNRISLWLEAQGLRYKTALEKVVPEVVFRLPKASLALFLNRLFACDGSIFVQNETQGLLSYATSSRQLGRDVQHLLLRFGVLSRLRTKSVKYRGEGRTAYELVVSHQDSLRRFIQEIGIFGKEVKQDQVERLLSGLQAHSNTDSLPESVCDYLLALKGERSWPEIYAAAGENCPVSYNPHLSGESRLLLSRAQAGEFARLFDDAYMARLATSDLYWDPIVSIESTGLKQVYDLTVPETHNFVAEDILVHNTTFAMNLVENALLKTEKPVLVFSMEMPADSIVMRMLSSLGRIDQTKVRTGKLEDDDWPRLTSAVNMLKDKPLYIDDTPGLSPTDVRSRARRVARENKGQLGMIMVDYLQLMRVPGSTEGRTAEISEISRSLKALAKEMQCPVIALSQLNRSLEQRPNKRPVNSDLRESGAIEQDADVIMFIYRDEVYNEDSPHKGVAEIIIGKQRNGPIGTVHLAFLGKYTKFEDLAHGSYEGNYE